MNNNFCTIFFENLSCYSYFLDNFVKFVGLMIFPEKYFIRGIVMCYCYTSIPI